MYRLLLGEWPCNYLKHQRAVAAPQCWKDATVIRCSSPVPELMHALRDQVAVHINRLWYIVTGKNETVGSLVGSLIRSGLPVYQTTGDYSELHVRSTAFEDGRYQVVLGKAYVPGNRKTRTSSWIPVFLVTNCLWKLQVWFKVKRENTNFIPKLFLGTYLVPDFYLWSI